MTFSKLTKAALIGFMAFCVAGVALWWIGDDQFRYTVEQTGSVTAFGAIGEIVPGAEVTQEFSATGDEVTALSLLVSTYGRTNTCDVVFTITDAAGNTFAEKCVNASGIADNATLYVAFDTPAKTVEGQTYYLIISSPNASAGNAVTVWYGTTMSAARTQVSVEIVPALVGATTCAGELSYSLVTKSYLLFGSIYWYLFAAACGAFLIYEIVVLARTHEGRPTLTTKLIHVFKRYKFLIKQLVSRDFKTKYKRSVLGIFWSFLNPLLAMAVQYIVFSTLFKSDIPNFPLYLLIGIVCFSFFSESVGMGLNSIVGNSSLITKVYVPKYIYPLTRVISSVINLLISLIPLTAVMILTGEPFTKAALLLPFPLLCLFLFCLGMALFLSSLMVFFRDTQFLWSVVSMLWMYLTPIFYPETIIPDKFSIILECNPLYHIIRFTRIILIDGVSPEPKAYLLCFLASVIPLAFGIIVFKKNQDKFILNL